MGARKAIDNIYWVGVLDKKLRVFDIIMQSGTGRQQDTDCSFYGEP